jgi:hypothetical protein
MSEQAPATETRLPAVPPLPDRVSLGEGFGYVHGPLVDDSGPIPYLGDTEVLDALKERVRHSAGGSFLVTGFRGTGKTTLILRMLGELEAGDDTLLEYIPVVLNVARPLSLDELLFEVVRRLFETLVDRDILDRLDTEVRRALILAYTRTSLSFKETRSKSTEGGASLDLGVGSIARLAGLAPKLGLSSKRTNSMATEASFLTYSHGDVEHDFLRILDLLNRPQATPTAPWRRARQRLRRRLKPWRGRVVVVLDELDKLPDDDTTVAGILAGFKNVFTTRHVHFIFVGGPHLHDAAVLDTSAGESVYNSAFAHQTYVPCLWKASDQLLSSVVEPDSLGPSQHALLQRYLQYKSRGIPRLLIQELNELVCWDGNRAFLRIDETMALRINFYAALESAVSSFTMSAGDEDAFTLEIDRDRWRLGAYYITDWVLRNRRRPFAASEIVSDSRGDSEWLMQAAPAKINGILAHFVKHRILRYAWNPAEGTIIGDAPQEATYEVVGSVRTQLSSLAHDSARERSKLSPQNAGTAATGEGAEPSVRAPSPWLETDGLGSVGDGRYRLDTIIGRGGSAVVYRAEDGVLGRDVAVKLLSEYLQSDETMRTRFRREAEVATTLQHPNIVSTYSIVDQPDGRLGIVMELVDGLPLRTLLPLTPERSLAVADSLLAALEYLENRGLARVDMKPENVIMRNGTTPVIVDLGLVKPFTEATSNFMTAPGSVIGTPSYMSPEQVRGEPLDIRSDLYVLAVVIFELISGETAWNADSPMRVLWMVLQDDLDVARLNVSAELRQALSRASARERDGRFPSAAEMRAALLATPEGASSYVDTPGMSPADR